MWKQHHRKLMISVSIDADDKPAGDLAAAVAAVVETARAEGANRRRPKLRPRSRPPSARRR